MSKKSFLGKTLAVIGAAAAIGGVCYIYRDKIKESKLYKDLDVDDKIDKAKKFITEKMPMNKNDDSEFFDEDEYFADASDLTDVPADVSEEAMPVNRGYVSVTPSAQEEAEQAAEEPVSEPEKEAAEKTDDTTAKETDDMESADIFKKAETFMPEEEETPSPADNADTFTFTSVDDEEPEIPTIHFSDAADMKEIDN